MNTKMTIVVRKDLKMRTGKVAAQVAHASMAFLTKKGEMVHAVSEGWSKPNHYFYFRNDEVLIENFFDEIDHWLENSFRKIVCYVNSEEELREIYQKALDKGLIAHIIEDNGATEFNGVKTLTACSVGPHWDSKFEGITDHLPLL